MALYKLVKGSTRLQNADGTWTRYATWDNNILDLTKEQAKSLGKRVVLLSEDEEEQVEEVEVAVTPRRRSRR